MTRQKNADRLLILGHLNSPHTFERLLFIIFRTLYTGQLVVSMQFPYIKLSFSVLFLSFTVFQELCQVQLSISEYSSINL